MKNLKKTIPIVSEEKNVYAFESAGPGYWDHGAYVCVTGHWEWGYPPYYVPTCYGDVCRRDNYSSFCLPGITDCEQCK